MFNMQQFWLQRFN